MQFHMLVMLNKRSTINRPIRYDLTDYREEDSTVNGLNKPESTNILSAIVSSQLVHNYTKKLVLTHHPSNKMVAI